ncbi:helix-turn-helix domain-containing protein [Pseudomonas sp. 5P_5.1_Bac1]|uniref:helix-turn-helix domain-containing protein n=1 Tax=Pseudomonas sp. 5P_5.1_Bac1 TaxID=2971616 RepID=UPI0021C5DE5D|nr:helix-turn-helix transcriptional regulator [Pseudomonas sp. 5P_5.1_Bac1]MCU1722399.1 helix-turn-helix domain-containing protein [Pseudomonas sp. 5P_5.1_Bac1]
MNNFDISQQIAEDAEIFGFARRAAAVFEIRRIMQSKGLKNIDIAERLGVSEANISRWLRGDQNLKLDTIYSLADAVQEKLNICFGESLGKRESASMRFSDAESWTIGVGVSCNDEDFDFFREPSISVNHEIFSYALAAEVEEYESFCAFNQ